MACKWGETEKVGVSPDWSLQRDYMKVERVVIADRHAAVSTFPGLVHTARHTRRGGGTRSSGANLRGGGCQGMDGNWGEVVKR